MNHRHLLLIALSATAVALSGCAAGTPTSSADTSTTKPTTQPDASEAADAPDYTPVKDCPATAKVNGPVERIVTSDAAAAAMLIELGVGDKIVGTAAPDFKKDFDGELLEQLDAIPVIDQGQGKAEAVLAAEPDLVTSISAMSFGMFDGTPTLQQLAENDIAVIAACDAALDGPNTGIEATYAYIESLATALDVEDRGSELIEELRASAQEAGGEPGDTRVLMYSTMPGGSGGLTTNGGQTFANGIVTLAGGTNIAADEQKPFVPLSAEEVTTSDPEVIVAVTGFSPDSDETIIEAVKNDPLIAETTAVKEGNIIAVPQRTLLSPSLKNSEAIAAINEAIAKK